MNVMREANLRTRIFPDHGALFYEMDLNIALLLQLLHPKRICAVPVQPVSLLHEHHAALLINFEEPEHVAELPSPCVLGGFHINEFPHNFQSTLARVFVQQLQLCGDRISFALLFSTGDSSVNHCCVHTVFFLRVVWRTRFSFRHRASAANLAISDRRSGGITSNRFLPPMLPW
ncbi:MAG TPA: hypothetical protein VG498_19775 [Terriglobales bacterium]|nr:hypothetical protein [Terriglobales bacterium]